MDTDIYPLTIYYESACALCRSEVANLALRDTGGKLRFVDVSDPDFRVPPPGTTPSDLLESIHAQRADGRVIKGVEVFRLAYRAVGIDWVAAALEMPIVRRFADRLYPWVARHRHRLPQWLGHAMFAMAIRRAAGRAGAATCRPGAPCDHETFPDRSAT